VALDWPAFGAALWRVNDELGIRPEWVLPVISLETAKTFDPAIVNPYGCVGINQFCGSTYSNYVRVPISEYRIWPASAQLAGPVLDYWRDALKSGPIDSSARLMLAQLSQAKLRTVRNLDDIVFAAPSAEYTNNKSFDTSNKGYITLRDLASATNAHFRTPAVQQALAYTYAMRPNESPPDELKYELVIPPSTSSRSGPLLVIGALALTVAAGYGAYKTRMVFA
jgi:hypothetical protein